MTTRSKVMAFAGFGLAAAVGISGCGSSSDGAEGGSGSGEAPAGTPKEKVAAAFKSLNDSSSAGFTLAVDTTAEDIKKIDEAEGSTPTSASDLKTIEQIVAGKVTMNMTAPEGKTFGQITEEQKNTGDLLKDAAAFEKALKDSGSFAMSVVHEDSGLFELSSKDGIFYVRADAEKIADMSGQNLNSVTGMLGQLPPVIATPAEKLFAGEWVSLDMVKAVQLMEKNGLLDELAKQENTAAAGTTDPAKVYALMDSLEASYNADSEVTEIDGGYQVSVPAKKTVEAIQDDLIAVIGEDEAAEIKKDLAKVPDKNFVFDVLVDDDKISGINVDIVQFMEKPVDAKFAINLGIDPEASAVQVPGDATALDIEALFNMIPADAFSSLGSGAGA